jgi:predicted aconitase
MSYERRMEITEEQRAILRGAEGPMMAKCLQTLLRHGDVFGARRLVPIKSAHLAGTFKILFYSAYYDLVHRLAESGIRVKVPTTLDPRPGYDFRIQNRFAFWGQRRLEADLEALGVLPNYSCVCYAQANVPQFGDVVGWAESSAIIYANSVIGARTNRNAIMIDVCQAVTGLTPEFGFLLDENRFGQIHFKLDIERMDAPALGFLIGRIAVDRVPVLDNYPFTKIELKNMGAAMAASGAVALFHVIGLTPEAPSMKAVFPNEPEEVHTITQKDLDDLRATAAVQKSSSVVAIGCPQMTLEEALDVGRHFVGKKLAKPAIFHLVPDAYDPFVRHEIGKGCLAAGVEVVKHCPLAALSLRIGAGAKQVLTPSGKLYYYLEGSEYCSLDDALKVCGAADAEQETMP